MTVRRHPLLVALFARYLPGPSGHEPAAGFKASGAVEPIELPGIVLASFATLSLGVVLGPEAPLIALGSGLGSWPCGCSIATRRRRPWR